MMGFDFCERCGRHPIECGCEPDPTMLDWQSRIDAIGRRLRAGENVVSLDAHRHRQRWNRHVATWNKDNKGGDNAA